MKKMLRLLLLAVFALNVNAHATWFFQDEEEKNWFRMEETITEPYESLSQIEYTVDLENNSADSVLNVVLGYASPNRHLGALLKDRKSLEINPGEHFKETYKLPLLTVNADADKKGARPMYIIRSKNVNENLHDEKSKGGLTATVDMKYDNSAKKGSLTVELKDNWWSWCGL